MNYRVCTKCGKRFEATSEFFHKSKHCKFGLNAVCKSCIKDYYKDNKEKFTKYKKQWYKDNIIRVKNRNEQWYIDNVDRIKQYNIDNADRIKKRAKKWRADNSDYIKQYRKDNRDKNNAHWAKYNAKKLNQTPQNANMALILFYYTVCATMKEYEVDHIKPLSKDGLHHEDNLQLLKRDLNMEKYNKWPLTPKEEIRYKGYKL